MKRSISLLVAVVSSVAFLSLAGCGSGSVAPTPTPAAQAAVAPSFSVAAGTYTGSQTVTLTTTTPAATIYYTTDGTTPTTSSSVYSGALSVSTSETVQAIANASGYTASSVSQAAYKISGIVNTMLSDDATEDWATIGVKVLSIQLVHHDPLTALSQAVTIYTAPSTGAPTINLVQLDQLSEILGNLTVPTGTYDQAILTLGANNTGTACDVSLVVSPDPEPGFDLPAGTSVPCSQIAIVGATGTAPNMTVPLTVNLKSLLTVTGASSNALDLEFDLRHPALIVEHFPVGATAPTWAVNFNGPVNHHPRPDVSKVLLRHMYGTVASVSTDNTAINVSRVVPAHPITSPETAAADTTPAIAVLADAVNGTLFFNLDSSGAPATITSFSSVASTIDGMYVRIAARYQQNGTLTATRIYASKSFNTIWQNPEGHVVHVNTKTNVMHVTTEDGKTTAVAIGPNTNFYFGSSNTAIGTGTTFFDGLTPGKLPNVARGFKVNVTIDPLSTAKPPVALSVEIDVARYDGAITTPDTTDFTYTRTFADADQLANDGYTGLIDYIASSSANTDQQGNAVNGFYWWDFGFPTLADTKSTAVADFVSGTSGATNFGGLVGALQPVGISFATWGDAAAPTTWSAKWVNLLPAPAPLGNIVSPFAASTSSFTYSIPLPTAAPKSTAAANTVTVDLMTASGSATLVYQVDRQSPTAVVTVTPQDISVAATLSAVGADLIKGVPVKVFGVPNPDGSIKAYTLFYYTNTASTK